MSGSLVLVCPSSQFRSGFSWNKECNQFEGRAVFYLLGFSLVSPMQPVFIKGVFVLFCSGDYE